MSLDLAVRGGRLVTPRGFADLNFGIRAGRVALVAHPSEPLDARDTIHADGLLVLPGLVDAHVHLREPGLGHKEGFETGTMAAAAGGVTTVMAMPTTMPPTVTPAAFEAKRRLAENRAYVDFAIQAGVGDTEDIPELVRLGAVSFELFLADLPPPLGIPDNGTFLAVLEELAAAGAAVAITPGDDAIVKRATEQAKAGAQGWQTFTRSRPHVAEALGVARACLLAAEVGVPIHLRQLSCRQAVEALRRMKAAARATAEVNPHHLVLGEGALEMVGAFAKMTPPLRSAEHRDALWQAVRDGTIETVATDHAPHLVEEKSTGGSDVWRPPGGIPGLQTMLPVMLREVAAGRLTLPEVVRLLAEAPARIFGLYPQKGALQPGSDADLVLVDPARRWTITNEAQLSKAKVTPFAGWEVVGWPMLTMLRGRVVMRDGKIEGPPCGRFVAPARGDVSTRRIPH